MNRYRNASGDSGVIAYSVGEDYITVRFRDKSEYVYNYEITGKYRVDEMKRLAIGGKGLATYINQHVRELYATKLQ
jgi:hypothetical protein